MPVYRRRNPNNSNRDLIKSWRVWIHWSEGDWTAETFKALNEQDRKKTQHRIRTGTEVWPWPEQKNPVSQYRIKNLKKLKMTHPIFESDFDCL